MQASRIHQRTLCLRRVARAGCALAWALAAVAGLLAPATLAAAEGTLTERVAIAGTPARSYAVYLPSGYDAERRWPLLILLDARQEAMPPLTAFRAAAERYGWILASSYDSFSDGDPAPTVDAVHAIHRDITARYAVDRQRVALAGFSGTARIASWLARTEPASFHAVVAAGAGFAETVPVVADLPFGWFATIGDRDFNYREVLRLEAELVRLGLPHHVEVYSAGHQWTPPELAAEAIAWLELLGMRTSARPLDEALVAELWQQAMSRAAAAEAAGQWLQAERLWRAAAADFATLRDTAPAAEGLAKLQARAEHREAVREDAGLAERELDLVRGAQRALMGLDPAETSPLQLAGRMGIDRLRKLAKSADPAEAAMAYRVLTAMRGQLGFYLPTAAEQRGNRALADLLRATAKEIGEL